MSLREEIADIIFNIPYTNAFTVNDFNRVLDEIMSKFEKRIDKMIKVAYEKDPVSVWSLTLVKEMLK